MKVRMRKVICWGEGKFGDGERYVFAVKRKIKSRKDEIDKVERKEQEIFCELFLEAIRIELKSTSEM